MKKSVMLHDYNRTLNNRENKWTDSLCVEIMDCWEWKHKYQRRCV